MTEFTCRFDQDILNMLATEVESKINADGVAAEDSLTLMFVYVVLREISEGSDGYYFDANENVMKTFGHLLCGKTE